MSGGAIAGIVIAVLVAAGLLTVAGWYFFGYTLRVFFIQTSVSSNPAPTVQQNPAASAETGSVMDSIRRHQEKQRAQTEQRQVRAKNKIRGKGIDVDSDDEANYDPYADNEDVNAIPMMSISPAKRDNPSSFSESVVSTPTMNDKAKPMTPKVDSNKSSTKDNNSKATQNAQQFEANPMKRDRSPTRKAADRSESSAQLESNPMKSGRSPKSAKTAPNQSPSRLHGTTSTTSPKSTSHVSSGSSSAPNPLARAAPRRSLTPNRGEGSNPKVIQMKSYELSPMKSRTGDANSSTTASDPRSQSPLSRQQRDLQAQLQQRVNVHRPPSPQQGLSSSSPPPPRDAK
jgi:hypothetical protein